MWHAAFRPIIFRKITITCRRDFNNLNPPVFDEHDPITKLNHLLDWDPSLGFLVKAVRVRFQIQGVWAAVSEAALWPKSCLEQIIQLLNERLPNVQHLVVVGMEEALMKPTDRLYAELTRATSIRWLSLVRCCIPYTVMNGIVSNIPNLKHLHIHNQWLASCEGEEFDLDKISPLTPFPDLKSFYYHNDRASGPTTDAFLTWSWPAQNLTAIGIHVDRLAVVPRVGKFLRELGGSLESLQINRIDPLSNWRWDSSPNSKWCMFSVSHTLSVLPTLTLVFLVSSFEEHIDLTIHTRLRVLSLHAHDHLLFSHFLSQIAAHPIRKIVLSSSPSALLDWVDSEENVNVTEKLLMGSEFPQLTEVLLTYKTGNEISPDCQSKLFPRLSKEEVFRVCAEMAVRHFSCIVSKQYLDYFRE